MKKILSVIICFALIVATVPLSAIQASAAKSGNYTYTVSNGKATITEVNTAIKGKVTIPSKLGGYPVTSIGEWAFAYCSSLTSVTIGNSVTSIGDSAFYWCPSLTSVTIGNSVTGIGNCAFFSCESLTSVTIGSSVTSIGISAFSECYSLTSIKVSEYNQNYSSVDGVLFNKDKTELVCYLEGKTNKDYTIPSSVISIGNYAFYNCYRLTSVTIPDSVISIGDHAFWGCDFLTSVTIGDSVTSIGEGAFDYCSSLTSVTIPDRVTSIGDAAFYNCDSLTSVTIGSSVTSIGDSAFEFCDSLTKVYYRGSRSDKNNITIGSYNGDLTSASWYYNSCIGYAEHIYDNDCDAQCNDCEYVREGVGHIYDNDCDSNCNICKTFRLTSHQYDNDEDYICNECFNERPPYVIGDISGDGSVNTTDLAVMKLFLAGIGDIDDNVKLAGDMTGDGQINTTDLAQLKLFLAGVDSAGSEVLTSEYTTQRFDKSYKNKKGEVLIEHYYDLIQLKGNSEAAQKINNSLKAQMDSFFMSNEELEGWAEGAEYLGPYCYTMDAKVSHNEGGYICVLTSYDWYMGGVSNFGYYGFTFNLSTGKAASLAELTGKTRISLENEIKTKVIEFFTEEHEYDVIDVAYEIKDYCLDDFGFFIENGEIVIVIPEYDIAPDTVTIKTGISVK